MPGAEVTAKLGTEEIVVAMPEGEYSFDAWMAPGTLIHNAQSPVVRFTHT